jgi:hypothetical protein
MADKFFVGDVGTLIKVDVGQDVTGATNTTLKVEKPDGTLVSWTATVNGQYLEYTVIAGDFDQAGRHYLQAALTFSGWTGLGETTTFILYDPFRPRT